MSLPNLLREIHRQLYVPAAIRMSEEKVFATYANTATKTKEKMEMHQSTEIESTTLEEKETTNEKELIKCNNIFCYWFSDMYPNTSHCRVFCADEIKICALRTKYDNMKMVDDIKLEDHSGIFISHEGTTFIPPHGQEYLGPKESDGKPDWSIFPFDEAEFILDTFAHGVKKYGAPFTYRKLINPRKLLAATIRHLIAIQNDHEYADDSDCLHWAHVGANALMALSRYRKVKN